MQTINPIGDAKTDCDEGAFMSEVLTRTHETFMIQLYNTNRLSAIFCEYLKAYLLLCAYILRTCGTTNTVPDFYEITKTGSEM